MIINQLNFEKLIFNPELLLKIKNNTQNFPIHTIISLTNYCNHKCLWCTAYEYQKEKAINIDTDNLLSFLQKSVKKGLKAVSYVGNGEPTLHPDFTKIVEQCNRFGLEQGIFTNGYNLKNLTKSYLSYFDFVRISLDAFSNDSHSITHGVPNQFETIINNIEHLVSSKNKNQKLPQIGIQYVFHQANHMGIEEITKIAKKLKVDYLSFKPAFNRGAILERTQKNSLDMKKTSTIILSLKEKYETNKFKIFFRDFQTKSIDKNIFKYKFCYAPLLNMLLYEQGEVMICGPQKIVIGNINETPNNISDKIISTYRKLDLTKCPGGCRYHSLNYLLDLFENKEKRKYLNENFI